jgi:peroxiredoxin
MKMTNKDVDIKTFKIKTHDDIADEFDKKEINNVISNSKSMLLLGELPGVGKTTTACNYACKKKLFVCPYNKLCQELHKKGIDAIITLNMLLGIGFNDEFNKKANNYDVSSSYDCIIFDEIFLYTPKSLKKIHVFMKLYKDKKIIGTGDW